MYSSETVKTRSTLFQIIIFLIILFSRNVAIDNNNGSHNYNKYSNFIQYKEVLVHWLTKDTERSMEPLVYR